MTNPNVDVAALAKLARLEVSAEELAKLQGELPGILAFVQSIQEVSHDAPTETPMLRNVMREDAAPHESGLYTTELLDAAPAHKGGQIVVMQVVSRKK